MDKLKQQAGQSDSLRRLRVFLCHSSCDKPAVRKLYQRLQTCNVDPWFDEESLLPGQDWEQEIRKAVRKTDVVIVCLSRGSISKVGFVQKEIKLALEAYDEQPEGIIFLIPLKMEECEVPERLKHLHSVNYFEDGGFIKLMKSLESKGESLNSKVLPVSQQSDRDAAFRKINELIYDAALDNLDHLWKRTEEVKKFPMTSKEHINVERVRLLLQTLLEDIRGLQHPPLTIEETTLLSQEIDFLITQAPFPKIVK